MELPEGQGLNPQGRSSFKRDKQRLVGVGAYVPYTGANQDVDLNYHSLNNVNSLNATYGGFDSLSCNSLTVYYGLSCDLYGTVYGNLYGSVYGGQVQGGGGFFSSSWNQGITTSIYDSYSGQTMYFEDGILVNFF